MFQEPIFEIVSFDEPTIDDNYVVSIIDDNEKEYSIKEWKRLKSKPCAVFVKYIDDELGEENAMLLYAGSKSAWPDLSNVRWANTPERFFNCVNMYYGDRYNGYKNCKSFIDIAVKNKIKEYNNCKGTKYMYMPAFESGNPIYDINDDFPIVMKTWQDCLPGIESVNNLRFTINNKIATAYIPAIGQLEKISNHLDEINEALLITGGEPIKVVSETGTVVYWSSNEGDLADTEQYYIFNELVKGSYYTTKAAKRSILPLFKITTENMVNDNELVEKQLIFVDKTYDNLQKIGPKHQILGLTHKGKFELGNTTLHKNSEGKDFVSCSLYYSKKIAVLN